VTEKLWPTVDVVVAGCKIMFAVFCANVRVHKNASIKKGRTHLLLMYLSMLFKSRGKGELVFIVFFLALLNIYSLFV
jgi:hypothetical protein